MTADAELEARARGRLGTTIAGKYRIDAVIGIGGMAVVYRATHRNNAQFAIKMLHPELSMRESLRKRFLREGRAANSVAHPGVVRVVDDDVAEDGAAFLVMELLEGTNLESLLHRSGGRLPVSVACGVLDQLLDVLAAVHAKNIVHRDLKPANLFLAKDGTLKVLDFGIARVRDALSTDASATGTGVLLGTPAFMAPEQARGKSSEIDARTDLWAASATFFALVAGENVHRGDNSAQLLIAAATSFPRSVATVAAVPGDIARVIDRGLSFERSARWANAAEMREELRRACARDLGAAPLRSMLAADAIATASSPSLPTAAMSVTSERTTPMVTSPAMSARGASPERRGSLVPIVLVGAVFATAAVSVALWKQNGAPDVREPAPLAMSTAPSEPSTPSEPPRPSSVAPAPTPSATETHAARPPTHRPPKSNCNPPYYVDSDGVQRFKKECL